MSEKICPGCGKNNPADMSYCLNCGNSLLGVAAQNIPSSAPDSVPTVFARPQQPPPNVQTNFQTNFQTPVVAAPGKSRAGFYLAVFGGIGLIVLLLLGGIAGMVAMNWNKIAGNGETNNNGRLVANTNVSVNNASNQKNSNRNTAINNSDLSSNSNLTPSFSPSPESDDSSDDNSSSADSTDPSAPSAVFNDVRIDYDVRQNGQNGMRIHTNFSVNNLKGRDLYLAICFETRDGKRLMDKNKKLYSEDGAVAVYASLKPGYDIADYKDTTVFMPYDELDLGPGKYALRLDADVIYKEGGLVQHLTYYDFDFSQ